MNAEHLTIRGLPPELAKALEQEKRKRGTSLNQTVIDLLESGLGVRKTRTNGLRYLAGTWSGAAYREFTDSIRLFEEVDPEMWQ